ncbi:hypothetical protein [Kangiella sp. TOML190]|uniref:hypothetical protein n=1 Tax=Kangiella sp. TOML190 TaxID=2931351 RepID=UPI00203E5CC7|nr:hypothetical protein [Kangiella sp. TOML190]
MDIYSLFFGVIGTIGVIATFHYSNKKKSVIEKMDDVQRDIKRIKNYSADNNKELIRESFTAVFYCFFLISLPLGLKIFIPVILPVEVLNPYYDMAISTLMAIGILGAAGVSFYMFKLLKKVKKPRLSIKKEKAKLKSLKSKKKSL